MKKISAGILTYRLNSGTIEVFLVHPGGPFWAKKDSGAWSIPKGEIEEDEDLLAAAKREFAEELGCPIPEGEFFALGEVKQPSGKIIHIWAMQADVKPGDIKSNQFKMEWPPHSGHEQEFPEVDKAEWFSLASAKTKLVKGQLPFLDTLTSLLNIAMPEAPTQASLF